MKTRLEAAVEIAQSGGALALDYFRRLETLTIEDKGPQDFVSDADRNVERHVRTLIAEVFPEDGIVGEEEDAKRSKSGYTWVIDPIDGTTNFITNIPAWAVVISVVYGGSIEVGVTFDPVHDELFVAQRGHGATLNGKELICPADKSMQRGSIGTGFSTRLATGPTIEVIQRVMEQGGVFHRNASGALSLAYVAAGRLNGYIEEHMKPWDCLAGQLLVAEAGGKVETQDAQQMIASGGRVVAGGAGVFDDLVRIADDVF